MGVQTPIFIDVFSACGGIILFERPQITQIDADFF